MHIITPLKPFYSKSSHPSFIIDAGLLESNSCLSLIQSDRKEALYCEAQHWSALKRWCNMWKLIVLSYHKIICITVDHCRTIFIYSDIEWCCLIHWYTWDLKQTCEQNMDDIVVVLTSLSWLSCGLVRVVVILLLVSKGFQLVWAVASNPNQTMQGFILPTPSLFMASHKPKNYSR